MPRDELEPCRRVEIGVLVPPGLALHCRTSMSLLKGQIRANEVEPQPWRNGGGQTRELYAWPRREDWRLRISLADILQDGPFSAYPGISRWFTVVDGAGVVLDFPQGQHRLERGAPPLCFEGGLAPDCRLIDGPTRDLNLMCRGGVGRMVAAWSEAPWSDRLTELFLFTTVAGSLISAAGEAEPVPAHTLAQLSLESGPLRFGPPEVELSSSIPQAWWMSFEPGPRP